MATTRTFVAVHLNQELRSSLVSATESLRRGPGGRAARWVAVDTMHLTLKFLAEVDDRLLPDICRAMTETGTRLPAFVLEVAGLGCFPNAQHPRIIWAGITRGASALTKMAGEVDRALSKLGFQLDGRPFAAHVTLGRADRYAAPAELASLGHRISSASPVSYGTMLVSAMSVVKSELRRSGPVYTDFATIALGSALAPPRAGGADRRA